MVAVLIASFGMSALLDSSLWVPKVSGLGWAIDFSNPHARWVVGFILFWAVVFILGLSHPDAPGVSIIMKML